MAPRMQRGESDVGVVFVASRWFSFHKPTMQRVKAVGKLVADGVRLTSSAGDNAVKRGRLAFVTKVLNRIEESKDPAFARRQEAADELVVIQAEMFRGFERVTGLFHEIGKEVE